MKFLIRILCLLILVCFEQMAAAQTIPLHLFSPEMKQSVLRPQVAVMDFLERYFQELSSQQQTTMQTKMADDKVYFRQGKPSDIYLVRDTMPFFVNLYDRYYEVSWTVDEHPFVTIVFPAQYDLILGINQDEAKKRLKEAILSAPERPPGQIPSLLEKSEDGFYVLAKDTFLIASLNDAIYYNNVDGSFEPVFSKEHLEYSAANLFHGLIRETDYRLYVEQSVYGIKNISYSLSFNQWLNYCAEWGLKVFFAVEEVREDGLLVLVIAQSKELGYNHLLSVTIPNKFISDKRTVLKARMTPYIPFHNVKNLFKVEANNQKKHTWK